MKNLNNKSKREIKKLSKMVDAIEALDEKMQALSDDELRAKTREFKDRLIAGETLDDLLVEAFAVVREAADRVLHMKPYRVQLMGSIVLHQGRIAEMKTGEGKTLVSTLPAYLNALEGKGVHIVTVNDYLAERDANWMGQVHRFLGLSVGVILNEYNNADRKAAYDCDITYITNNELPSCGFSKTNYIFKGWNTKADGTGESYKPNATLTTIPSKLYAQWAKTSYKVNLVYTGGTIKINGVATLYQVITTTQQLLVV